MRAEPGLPVSRGGGSCRKNCGWRERKLRARRGLGTDVCLRIKNKDNLKRYLSVFRVDYNNSKLATSWFPTTRASWEDQDDIHGQFLRVWCPSYHFCEDNRRILGVSFRRLVNQQA
ncbi:hypothetical protein NDU88_006467 [Pleurodeles waltl]|uniref:Uncharacterized protein n=1 Tax=Pleurodeles waltl TaxID=8319 RepID=A0AAV7VM02_PLEWA|nr:hypothetical protein NDU88_006467 [Pleurodeles waltl]